MIVLDRTIYTVAAVSAVQQLWLVQNEPLPLAEHPSGWVLAEDSLDRMRFGDMLNELLRRSLLERLQAPS